MASTTISSYDELEISCSTTLPSYMECQIILDPVHLSGVSIDFQIEKPNYEDAKKNEEYFNGMMDCHTFVEHSFHSEVKYFSFNIKNGSFSLKVPQYDNQPSGKAYFRCIGTNVTLPDNFGFVKSNAGDIVRNAEAKLRVRTEYKRDNISRQFADSYSRSKISLISPPIRTHGKDIDDKLIPYLPLSNAISIESSGTVFDAKEGFKLVLKGVQHRIHQLEIDYLRNFYPFLGARFSSLAPDNTYYESYFVQKYANCTVEVTGTSSHTFESALVFSDTNGLFGLIEFKIRDSDKRDSWINVDIDTTGTDIAVTCPQVTILNPSELPSLATVTGRVIDYNHQPTILSTSSALALTGLTTLSVTIAAIVLSLF